MEQIRKYFETIYKLSEKDWLTFSSKLIKQDFPKKHLLLKAGQIENHLSFVEKGIIHHIPTTDNSILYALCKDNCEAGHHHDNHVHFICDVCNKTICLDEVTVPSVQLPKGFKPDHAEMVVNGICGDCK